MIILNYCRLYSLLLGLGSMIFIKNWYLFALYLLLNILDNITGWIKAKVNNKENSKIAREGILRKVSNWIIIVITFAISAGFLEIGKIISIDLSILMTLGWVVLGSLIINEVRSILENLVEAGCKVPKALIKGLEVAEAALDDEDD